MQTSDNHKVQLTGSILGVESCHIATDSDEVRVGSSLDADLVVLDPLVPPLAFTIRRHKQHGESARPCECRWIINVHAPARVFVNEHLTTRESLVFGDTIASGCHHFVFAPADPRPRNRKSNTAVHDLCAALLKHQTLPPGFLKTCPWHQHARRLRRAMAWGGTLAVILLLLFFITPSAPRFESIQPPMEVTILADRIELPAPDAVRSLKDVQRQTFVPSAIPEAAQPEPSTPFVADARAEVKTVDALPAPPPAPALAQAATLITTLVPAELKGVEREPGMVNRDPIRLASTAPTRRLTISEATGTAAVELQPVRIQAPAPAALYASAVSATTGNGIQAPDNRVLDRNRAQRLEALAVFKPSPVRFETASGHQVPVARMSESLAPMESVKPGDYQVDGKVTEGEIAKSWKSGRFRIHAPGHPPPEANPATYCYVGRAEAGGKPCLYISFICSDPNTDKLITKIIRNVPYNKIDNPPYITHDDSLEIFLDTNNDRRDYHQMIVNARGVYWAAYWPSTVDYGKGNVRPWDTQATIKTSIDKAAGQWVCEILIPFERLGGVPAKGTRWTVNFCRNFRGQFAEWQLQTWFEVYDKRRDFHRPDKFGMFEW